MVFEKIVQRVGADLRVPGFADPPLRGRHAGAPTLDRLVALFFQRSYCAPLALRSQSYPYPGGLESATFRTSWRQSRRKLLFQKISAKLL
jgi:hypothetical protein